MRIRIERIAFWGGWLGGSFAEIAFERHAIWLSPGNRQIQTFVVPSEVQKVRLLREGDEVTLWTTGQNTIVAVRNHTMGDEEFFEPHQIYSKDKIS